MVSADAAIVEGPDAEMVLCNDRYIEMYGLSPDVVKLGCSHVEMLRHRKEIGCFSGDPEELSRQRRARVAEGRPFSVVHELAERTLTGGDLAGDRGQRAGEVLDLLRHVIDELLVLGIGGFREKADLIVNSMGGKEYK